MSDTLDLAWKNANGTKPVVLVEVEYRSGQTDTVAFDEMHWDWSEYAPSSDIVRYRMVGVINS